VIKKSIEKHVIGVLFVEYRLSLLIRGCRGHDRLIVGFTTIKFLNFVDN
jgi:hypothetical protein